MRLLAQGTNLGTFEGIGPLGTFAVEKSGVSAFATFTTVLSTALGILTVSGGVWFIFQILAGAFQWLSSGGEKQGLENARKRITNAIVGLFIVIFSYGLIAIVGSVFGINILSPYAALLGFGPGNIPAGVLVPAQP